MSENVVHLHKPTDPPTPDTAPTVLTVVPDAPPARPVPLWVRSGRAVKTAATHESTRTTLRAAARHSLYTLNGGRIVARRAWDGRTGSRYERMIRAAEAAGNLEVGRGVGGAVAALPRRPPPPPHGPAPLPGEAAKGVAVGAGVSIGVAGRPRRRHGHQHQGRRRRHHAAGRDDRLHRAADPDRAGGVGPGALDRPVPGPARPVVGGPQAAGRTRTGHSRPTRGPTRASRSPRRSWSRPCATSECPRCATPSRRWATPAPPCSDRSGSPDAAWKSTSPSPPGCRRTRCRASAASSRRTSPGTSTKCSSPSRRPPARCGCGSPTPGALDEPIGPSPLVTDETMTADYAKGRAPWGQDLRGDAAALSLYQRHLLITGLSNQGKTAALRALALWLALDPSVRVPHRRPQGRRRLGHVRRPRHHPDPGPDRRARHRGDRDGRGRGGGDEPPHPGPARHRVPAADPAGRRSAGGVHVPGHGRRTSAPTAAPRPPPATSWPPARSTTRAAR